MVCTRARDDRFASRDCRAQRIERVSCSVSDAGVVHMRAPQVDPVVCIEQYKLREVLFFCGELLLRSDVVEFWMSQDVRQRGGEDVWQRNVEIVGGYGIHDWCGVCRGSRLSWCPGRLSARQLRPSGFAMVTVHVPAKGEPSYAVRRAAFTRCTFAAQASM